MNTRYDPPMITIHSHPSTQQITNLIIYGVATSVTPTYNTTNTPNKLLSHHFICNVPYNETAETSSFFCSFIVHITTPCLASKYSRYQIHLLDQYERSVLTRVH